MIVSEQIISVLDYMCEKFGLAIDWTADNMLPYVTELMAKFIRYEIATSIAWCVFMIVLNVTLCVLFLRLNKSAKKVNYCDYEPETIFAILTGVCLVLCTLVTVFVVGEQMFDIITCVTFPEKFIAEYAMELLNNK